MKSYFLILTSLVCFSCYSQSAPIRLIVRGDDMGYSHSGNEALIKCAKEGIQTSIEVIVPSPWFPEAVQLLKQNPQIDIGIHLAITSEWDNEKWRPLTIATSLRDSNGYFLPMVYPNKNYPGLALRERTINVADVEKEFRAQIETAVRLIPGISHLSSHMGCTDLNDSIKAMVKRLAEEYKLPIDLSAQKVQYVSYNGPHKTSKEKVASFIKMIETLKPGTNYIFVDHPGLDSPELRAIHHIGYENVAEDRQGVVDAWTNAAVKALIKKKKIQLLSYREMLGLK